MSDLQRFVDAQASVYDTALAELQAGRKRTHWMWFVFPQLGRLGRSSTGQYYGLDGLAHARSYGAHPLLGPRLRACVAATLSVDEGVSANEIFGSPDDLKFCSCLTLFALATGDPVFEQALGRFFGGRRDRVTEGMVAEGRGPHGGVTPNTSDTADRRYN